MHPSSSLPLLLTTSHLLGIFPFHTAGADVELASPLLATKGGSSGLSMLLDRSVKASLRRNEAQKFDSQDTILDGYITTYNYVGASCTTFFSGSTEKLNYCAAMSYSVYRKITATSSATTTEYTTKYYGDAMCTEAELLSSDPPVKYETGVCSSKGGYSLKKFHESKITTELQLPRFTSM
jgi:hypothetical protein